jgi:hypothetical protein
MEPLSRNSTSLKQIKQLSHFWKFAFHTARQQQSINTLFSVGSVLWIRISFNANPDPACYLNADPNPDPGSQTNADPDPGQIFKFKVTKKLNFHMKNILKVCNRSKNIHTKVQKPF